MAAIGDASFWTRLFSHEGKPSEAFLRFADAAFSYIIENSEFKDSRTTELTPGKLGWLFEDLGHSPDSMPIPLDNLPTYYRQLSIPFVMRKVEGFPTKVAALLKHGWIQLLSTCFFKDPDLAWQDMNQMIQQFELLDPSTGEPFPLVPRSAAPPRAVESFAKKHAEITKGRDGISLPDVGALKLDNKAPSSPSTVVDQRSAPSSVGTATQNQSPPPYSPAEPMGKPAGAFDTYGPTLFVSGKASPGYLRLYREIFLYTIKHAVPRHEPSDLITPCRRFWLELEGGSTLSEATYAFSDHRAVYDALSISYTMKECTIPEEMFTGATLRPTSEIIPFLRAGEGMHPCFDIDQWATMAITSNLTPDDAHKTGNRLINSWKLIDPETGHPFPKIPRSFFLEVPDEAVAEAVGAAFATAGKQSWRDPLITETEEVVLATPKFKRFAAATFDYVLKNATPRTNPADNVALFDLVWWYREMDNQVYADRILDEDLLDWFKQGWTSLGIEFSMREVNEYDSDRKMVLPCLDMNGWCTFLTMEALHSPDYFHGVICMMIEKWPLMDAYTNQRFIPPPEELMPPVSEWVESKWDEASREVLEQSAPMPTRSPSPPTSSRDQQDKYAKRHMENDNIRTAASIVKLGLALFGVGN